MVPDRNRQLQRTRECQRVRTRQDGQRCQLLWTLISDLPRKAGTPIMADKMETPITIPDSGHGYRAHR